MFDVVLFELEILPTPATSLQLCTNASTRLRLICPLGFPQTISATRLDYHERERATVELHCNLAVFLTEGVSH